MKYIRTWREGKWLKMGDKSMPTFTTCIDAMFEMEHIEVKEEANEEENVGHPLEVAKSLKG